MALLYEPARGGHIRAVDFHDYASNGEEKPELRFLLIGEYAVAAHGRSRSTFDVEYIPTP